MLFLSLDHFTRARDELRVNETNSRILLGKTPAEVLLAVDNPSTNNVNANVQLELIDPRNKTIATTTQVQPVARGSQTLRLSLPFTFPSADEKERHRILWY